MHKEHFSVAEHQGEAFIQNCAMYTEVQRGKLVSNNTGSISSENLSPDTQSC